MVDERTRQILDYIKRFFEIYSINEFGVLSGYDEKTGTIIDTEFLKGTPDDEKRLEWLSGYIGLTVEEIKQTDEKALMRYAEKYPFFIYYLSYKAESINQGVFNDGLTTEERLLKRIFGKQCTLRNEKKRYNQATIKKRLISEIKNIDQLIPGTYHKDATIENLEISTAPSVISFPQITLMLSSFFNMIEEAKKLFFKALKTDLYQEEILEYNFLVNVLQLKSATTYYMNYKYVVENRKEYLKDDQHDFFCFVRVKSLIKSAPWKCKQFFDDPLLVEKFFDTFRDAKEEMFKYYMNVSRFYCTFNWSDAKPFQLDETDETDFFLLNSPLWTGDIPPEKTYIYVKKTPEELFDWSDHLEKIRKISSCVAKGGMDTRKWDEREAIMSKRWKEYFLALANTDIPIDDETETDESVEKAIEEIDELRGVLGWKS